MLLCCSVPRTCEVKPSRLVAAQRATGPAASVESRLFARGSSTCQTVHQAPGQSTEFNTMEIHFECISSNSMLELTLYPSTIRVCLSRDVMGLVGVGEDGERRSHVNSPVARLEPRNPIASSAITRVHVALVGENSRSTHAYLIVGLYCPSRQAFHRDQNPMIPKCHP